MKVVKYPARAIIVRVFCDCGKGEMLFTEMSGQDYLHTCSNSECLKTAILAQKVPFSGAELLNAVEEQLEIPETKE
jgi:hypothetical protein